jgi:hypothetical protein
LLLKGFRFFLVFSIIFYSCKSSLEVGSSYRFIPNESSGVLAVTPLVVDLCIDFDRIIQSESNNYFSTPSEAIENAEFLALMDSGNHVLIAPIYEVIEEDISRWYHSKRRYHYKAKVLAFSGVYCKQYSMMGALEKCKSLSINSFYHDQLSNMNGGSWLVNDRDEAMLIPGEVFILKDGMKQTIDEMALNRRNQEMESSDLTELNVAGMSVDSMVKKMFMNELTSQDALLHNDDYLTSWMNESSAFTEKLKDPASIMQLEDELLKKKYLPSRDSITSLRLIEIDYHLLEAEWLNRDVIQFYSNFNLLRAKKLIEDGILSASSEQLEVLSKYKEMGDYWYEKSLENFYVLESTRPLYKDAIPVRRKINCEFYASEFYTRGWQVFAHERDDLAFNPQQVSSDLNPWNVANTSKKTTSNLLKDPESSGMEVFAFSDTSKWKISILDDQKDSANPNAQTVNFKSQFPFGSYGYYWELSQNLPDSLKEPIFATFTRADIPPDAKIPGPVRYPKGIVFVVQVGAFRRDLPLSFYHQFAPILSEDKGQGIHRYTAGLFVTIAQARESLQIIKNLGFSDAFIAALKDGRRIPLNEAIQWIEK